MDEGTLAHGTLARLFVEIELSHVSDVTSDRDLATIVQEAFLEQAHQAVGRVEGDLYRICVIDEIGQESDREPLVTVVLHDFGVRQTTSDGQAVELGVLFVVRHVCQI